MSTAHVLAALTVLLGVGASTSSAQHEREPQTIEMEMYTVSAPPGGGWKVERDKKDGTIRFQKRNPVTIIQVSYNRVVKEEMLQWSEEQVASDYRQGEVGNMMVHGAIERTYVPQDVKQDTISLDGKKLYTLGYTTIGQPFGNPNGQAILYLYFPPNFREEHTFYLFLMHVVIGNEDSSKQANFAPIHQVIDSFRVR
jgi:hypothetical protein